MHMDNAIYHMQCNKSDSEPISLQYIIVDISRVNSRFVTTAGGKRMEYIN